MRKIKFGNGFTIFTIFFAIALFQAINAGDWGSMLWWLLIGSLFVLADNLKFR